MAFTLAFAWAPWKHKDADDIGKGSTLPGSIKLAGRIQHVDVGDCSSSEAEVILPAAAHPDARKQRRAQAEAVRITKVKKELGEAMLETMKSSNRSPKDLQELTAGMKASEANNERIQAEIAESKGHSGTDASKVKHELAGNAAPNLQEIMANMKDSEATMDQVQRQLAELKGVCGTDASKREHERVRGQMQVNANTSSQQAWEPIVLVQPENTCATAPSVGTEF